jgi:hypothetical protein
MKDKTARQKYSEKFKDPRWQKLRLKVLERDKWTCQHCYDTENTLAVHHKYYIKGKEPWDYPLSAFMTLCEDCHREEYESRPECEEHLLHALRERGFSASDVQNLAIGFHEMRLRHLPEVVAAAYEWALKTPDSQDRVLEMYFDHLRKRGNTWCEDLEHKMEDAEQPPQRDK